MSSLSDMAKSIGIFGSNSPMDLNHPANQPFNYKNVLTPQDEMDAALRKYQANQKKPPSFMTMIASRMRWDPLTMAPFDFIEATACGKDKVVVFFVKDGQAGMLEDGADLFPSDTLITQLRILTT